MSHTCPYRDFRLLWNPRKVDALSRFSGYGNLLFLGKAENLALRSHMRSRAQRDHVLREEGLRHAALLHDRVAGVIRVAEAHGHTGGRGVAPKAAPPALTAAA